MSFSASLKEAYHEPGTRTLSQNPVLKMLSIDNIPEVSSCGLFGAIVGGKVDISTTGPISLLDWKASILELRASKWDPRKPRLLSVPF